MKTGLHDIDKLLELNEQLNQEFIEAKRELQTIELNNLLTNIEIGMVDQEKIIRFLKKCD